MFQKYKWSLAFCFGLVCILSTCTKEDEALKPAPTKGELVGFWKLAEVTDKTGNTISFSNYPYPHVSPPDLDSLYFSLDDTDQANVVTELSISVMNQYGTWSVNEFNLIVGDLKYSVDAFTETTLTLIDKQDLNYILHFKRISEDAFPKTQMTLKLNGADWTANSNQAYRESNGSFLGLTGSDSQNNWIDLIINFPLPSQGATVEINGSQFSAVFADKGDFVNLFQAQSGQFTFTKLTDHYVEVHFNFITNERNGLQYQFTNGIFKAIIKDN